MLGDWLYGASFSLPSCSVFVMADKSVQYNVVVSEFPPIYRDLLWALVLQSEFHFVQTIEVKNTL
jgi:hypothetical protein